MRCICGRTRFAHWSQLKQQHKPTRSISNSTETKDPHQNAEEDDPREAVLYRTRENAIKARLPSYTGWWTEVMNFHQTPQSLPDPALLLSEGHVFQGRPLLQPSPPTPTPSEIKKGYSNTLPTAVSKKTENTLPTAVSRGSASFATGTVSGLSQPTTESTLYHGFSIPVKATPPGAEDCCMSGCAHCVYDIYEEDRQEYKRKLAKVLEEIEKAGLPPPPNVATSGSSSSDGSTGGKGMDDDDSDMDPGMKAFLELERKLKGS
ncbi:hypothetical protein BGZ65_011127 [Modicella reniformis]|uniref:Oxidoreductase-like domain-containing protein n=1 Tax=Modicella reniformis TaxID=1440133 RepID=A0A9P6SV46_9FUNG|nr:hypothetical protein BGZ65_011127 [Modicella reniformis]